jgi:uncharacterized protein YneF (UPF0154 family)
MISKQDILDLPPIARIILSILAGVIAGVVLINIIDTFSPWQPPPGADYTSGTPPYQQWVQSLPNSAFVLILVSLLAGSILGGFVTGKLSPRAKFPPQLVTGFTILFYVIVKYLAFPNPEWMSYSSVIGSMVFAWVGGWMARGAGLDGRF